MSDIPNLAIGLVTYRRTVEAIRTIIGVCKYLGYPKDHRAWFINDDGSPPEHANSIRMTLDNFGENLQFINTERLGGETYFCGKGWNLALGNAHQYSDYVLWLEDDWELSNPFPVESYITLLREREDVGMVSFRNMGTGNTVTTEGYGGIHYLQFDSGGYIYSGNPHIRHARFTRFYGGFSEDRNPGEIELEFNQRILDFGPGPKIWRPAGINEWGAFGHIGREKAYK